MQEVKFTPYIAPSSKIRFDELIGFGDGIKQETTFYNTPSIGKLDQTPSIEESPPHEKVDFNVSIPYVWNNSKKDNEMVPAKIPEKDKDENDDIDSLQFDSQRNESIFKGNHEQDEVNNCH